MTKSRIQIRQRSNKETLKKETTSDNLRALYNHAYDETKHYRSYEWQITVWTVSLLGAIFSVPQFLKPTASEIQTFKWLLSLFSVFFSISSIVLIFHCHKSLTFNRKLIRKLETKFNFYEVMIGDPPIPLFPNHAVKSITMWRGCFHLLNWILAILSISGFALYRIYMWQP
jgi:hypothetical protein